jgi:hypothetical protein
MAALPSSAVEKIALIANRNFKIRSRALRGPAFPPVISLQIAEIVAPKHTRPIGPFEKI